MDPLEAGKLLILLAGLAGLYLKLNQAMRSMAGKGETREITNNPLNTRAVSRGATMEDVDALALRVTRLETRIVHDAAAAQEASRQTHSKIDDLHDRLDDKLSAVSDRLQEISRAVGRLEGS